MELVSQNTEVLPGVWLLPAPGHTPGHLVVALTAGNDGALYLGDYAGTPVARRMKVSNARSGKTLCRKMMGLAP